jgi:predicted dehydrogenase
MNWLEYFDHKDEAHVRGWRKIHITEGEQPYMKRWWIPGTSIGYEHSFIHQAADFFLSLQTGEPCSPTFQDAMETQKVCQAVLDSASSRSWKDTGVNWKG